MIVYYTIISNIVCLIFFATIVVTDYKKKLLLNDTYYAIKFSVTIAIFITMIAFEFVVRPYVHNQTGYSATNIRDTIVHLIVPLLVLGDYFLFDCKGRLKFKFLPYTTILPLLYSAFVFFYSNAGGTFRAFKQVSSYPYIFMDYSEFGALIFVWCGLILLVFIGSGTFLIFIDKIISR